MSIRNMDADLASNKLNELFHLHRYDDCVLFLNRLSHFTVKIVISQISIEMFLSRLPYTIEIFEAIYAKIFIMDPDNFPTRILQPEKIIDKMVAYFSLLSDETKMEPIDGAKMLDSFENVIRIISYVQPNLYSRLLYFKYAIDKILLRFEKDLAYYNKNIFKQLSNNSNGNNLYLINTSDLNTLQLAQNSLSKKDKQSTNTATKNALLISRISNMQTCESIRLELSQTMANCDKALNKLNEHINSLKSQKIFKEAQVYFNQHQNESGHNEEKLSSKSPKVAKKSSSTVRKNEAEINDKYKTIRNRSESLSTANRNRNSLPENVFNNNFSDENDIYMTIKSQRNVDNRQSFANSLCQDFIQNRLYLNKAMMNSIEPFLETIKLQETLTALCEKIDLDKEILLVFTHLKREEKYLNSLEPLEPLFRRYALGFERTIQIWRKKCSADSLLLVNDKLNNSLPSLNEITNGNYYQVSTLPNSRSQQPIDQLYVLPNEDSYKLDRIQSSYTSSAVVSASPLIVPKLSSNKKQLEDKSYKHGANIVSSTSAAVNLAEMDNLNDQDQSNHQKYYSEVNLYTHPLPSIYSTMPAKFRIHKKTTIPKTFSSNGYPRLKDIDFNETEYDMTRITMKPPQTKNAQSQTNLESCVVNRSTTTSLKSLKKEKIDVGLETESFEAERTNPSETNNNSELNGQSQQSKSEVKLDKEIIYIEKQVVSNDHSKDLEIESLNKELSTLKETIAKLRKNESKLREKMKESEELESLAEKISEDHFFQKSKEAFYSNSIQNYTDCQYTSDLIHLYTNLNNKYRYDAYESLSYVKEIHNMTEFKLKLLFSVVVLAYRYVKLYIKDIKRKIKVILQINDRSNSTERTNSQKSQVMTPTIIVQKPDEIVNEANSSNTPTTSTSLNNQIFFNDDLARNHHENQANRTTFSKYIGNTPVDKKISEESPVQVIENALNKYFQIVTSNNSFDLNRIVENVKEQLWNTLHEYPLKDCQELNSYINESVKTCWALINHQPPFRLDYSSSKFDFKFHERSDVSDRQSDQIIQYIWPSLIDTSDGSCLSKGIVIT